MIRLTFSYDLPWLPNVLKMIIFAARVMVLLLIIEAAYRVGRHLVAGLIDGIFAGNPTGILPVFLAMAVVNCTFLIFEASEDPSKLSGKRFAACYGRAILITIIFYCLTAPGHALAGVLIERNWLVPLFVPNDFSPFIVVYPLLFLLIQDFFYYWLHRFMHRSSWLWRFHAIHHSLEALTSWNGYHHWFEEYLRLLVVLIPTVIIMQPPPQDIFLLSALLYGWGSYLHSSARCIALPAPLRAYVADNVYHHYHHAIDRQYHDKNFAAYFPLWDRMFGTQHLPEGDALPKVGIANETSAQGVFDYVYRPFISKSGVSEDRSDLMNASEGAPTSHKHA